MGLSVILDSHSDLIDTRSIFSDYKGFTIAITSQDEFPITKQNEIQVKPMHLNNFAVMPIKLDADDSIRAISPAQRNCYFPDETSSVKLFKKYTQANCLLECSMALTQKKARIENKTLDCIPWFLPFVDRNAKVCDPWQKHIYLETMRLQFGDDDCSYCLPDCQKVIYQFQISNQEFRQCDNKNFWVSKLCSKQDPSITPQKWAGDVIPLVKDKNKTHMLNYIDSDLRSKYAKDSFLGKPDELYDAYDEDIGVLNIYYASPTALHYITRPSRTFFDFVSAIGGDGGIFIGFSFVTCFEILWLLARLLLTVLGKN